MRLGHMLGARLRRHPLTLAMAASLALHGAALAASLYLWHGTAPTPANTRTVALVMIEHETPTPDAQAPAPARQPNLLPARPPAHDESVQTPVAPKPPLKATPVRAPTPPPKPVTPDASRERDAAAPPKVPPPPRRTPVPTRSGSEARPDSRSPATTESGPTPDSETAAVPPSLPVASERSVPTSASNVAAGHPSKHASRRLEQPNSSSSPSPDLIGGSSGRSMDAPDKPGHDDSTLEQRALRRMIPPRYGISGIANPRPRYPWLSRQRGEEGRVVLRVAVDEVGRAIEVIVFASSGHGRLDRAAVSAVRRWRFAPASSGGRAVPGTVDVPVTFRLSDG